MKKIFSLLVALAMVLSMGACGKKESMESDSSVVSADSGQNVRESADREIGRAHV